tara:strand:+ start:9464 stop:10231 length:768 start_codon:yes stop_codon:yes gene_type:complete
MIYLKTYCYAPHEVEFIIANLKECYDYIDKMIVCEFDINHTGVKRPFEYSDLKSLVPEELSDKLDYHACEVYDITARAYEDEAAIHGVNEPVMRSYFTKLYNFSDNDIIISIDADEILYGEQLPYIIEQVSKQGAVRLKLRQFFYKKTYLWEGRDFVSPIATYYGVMNPKFPNNWRDVGNVTKEYVGCHFSWCMGIEAMIHKLDTYSHPRYRFCADRDLLENSVANKTYPFDDNVSFDIRELPADDNLIPKSMRS